MPFRLNSVVLTGASTGLGEELAYRLASQGAWLTLAARDEERLEEVAHRCRLLGDHKRAQVQVVPTDVTDEEQCKKLMESAVAEYGRLDTLINNAGMMMAADFENVSDTELYRQLMEVNFYGTMYCAKHALPHLKDSSGRLVLISSQLAKMGGPMYSGFAASKAAATAFFESLRMELSGDGVSVTVIYPTKINTGVHQRGLGAHGEQMGDDGRYLDMDGMRVDKAVDRIVHAMANRSREETLSWRSKVASVLRPIVPSVVESTVRGAYLRREEEAR